MPARKPPKRPIDAKDMPCSALEGDDLDKAAEDLWNNMLRPMTRREAPYHLMPSAIQFQAQEAVLSVLGSVVPALLRERAKELKGNTYRTTRKELRDLAAEIEEENQ